MSDNVTGTRKNSHLANSYGERQRQRCCGFVIISIIIIVIAIIIIIIIIIIIMIISMIIFIIIITISQVLPRNCLLFNEHT